MIINKIDLGKAPDHILYLRVGRVGFPKTYIFKTEQESIPVGSVRMPTVPQTSFAVVTNYTCRKHTALNKISQGRLEIFILQDDKQTDRHTERTL